MNTKLLATTLGVLLLAGSGVALADDWHGHGREPVRGPERHGWDNDRWDRAERHWHEYHRHYERRWNGYWVPAPVWQAPRPYYRDYYAPPYYDDGVTIILRGRLN
jgi:hypothetical protein